ncbi:MAG: M67 family metallopeptidase [Anaerolineaceae bacterium]|nr:M67 family metallopeptidase [Anaerolineaceae bacterium]
MYHHWKDRAPLLIRFNLYESMRQHAQSVPGEEICGLVGGRGLRARVYQPVENILHSPRAYRMNPQEQVDAIIGFERKGLELLAIAHSHPSGPARPSWTDIREFAYPDVFTIIWYPDESNWVMNAFLIKGRGYQPVPWELIE